MTISCKCLHSKLEKNFSIVTLIIPFFPSTKIPSKFVLNCLKIEEKKMQFNKCLKYQWERYLFIRKLRQGYLPLSHRTEHSFSFSIYIENKKEKISQGAEYCTSRKKEQRSKLKHDIQRGFSRFVTSLYVRKQEELRTACYQMKDYRDGNGHKRKRDTYE